MVQKFQSPVRVYKFPFELVMAAYERRFPKCPQMPIVLDCEVIKDEVLDNGARRNTSRRCKLAVDAPYLFKKIIGVDVVYFMQANFLDLANRTLSIEATNETYSSRIEIFERCRYYVHPDNPDWTCFDQTATLDIKNFFGFENSMEKMGMKQYTQTTLKGREIIEYFIDQLKSEGISHVDRWQASDVTIPPELSPTKLGSDEADTSDMLDGDFIAKHLGNLSPMQESKLLEFHKLCKDTSEIDKCPTYQTLLRFLRARDFNVEKALLMLKESLAWRADNNIDELLKEYKTPHVMLKHFPGGWHHQDKDGRPMYILRLGHMDVKGLLKAVGEEGLLKLTLHICEEGMQLINESAVHLGKPVLSWCLLVDLEGLSMRHLWRPGIKVLLKVIETVEKNYPETMGRVLVVRAPRVFPIAWTIVSTFIDETTRSKFLFYGGPDCLHMKDGLEQYIDSEIIPDFLGGSCKTLIHEGGLVPKTLYKMNSEEEESQNGALLHDHHNLYKSIDVRPGCIHEVVIKNNDPKSVLTWDFDVMKSDLYFTLYRTTKELPPKNDSSTSFFDLSGFEEGKNYFREEPSTICRHKESVQGSHVMNSADIYIMHWYCPASSSSSTTSGPAQLMYFYEVLSSANYKGSMTSLQSGCSALSVASSCQSR